VSAFFYHKLWSRSPYAPVRTNVRHLRACVPKAFWVTEYYKCHLEGKFQMNFRTSREILHLHQGPQDLWILRSWLATLVVVLLAACCLWIYLIDRVLYVVITHRGNFLVLYAEHNTKPDLWIPYLIVWTDTVLRHTRDFTNCLPHICLRFWR
jgi:hypothetical protein